MASVGISLSMIVRDEARDIAECLDHHRGIVEEMVVIDTGSTDGTPALARAAGAQVHAIEWHDDFALARNVSLLRATGDWVLVLDADERIDSADFARVRACVSERHAAAHTLSIRTYSNDAEFFMWQPVTEPLDRSRVGYRVARDDWSGYYVTEPIRLFRRDPRITFSGRVHESVLPAVTSAGLLWTPSGVVVHHFTVARSEASRREKRARYLALSRAKAAEQPDDAQAQSELGFTALEDRDFAVAIPALRRGVRLAPERALLREFLGAALLQAHEWAEAAEVYADAIARFPDHASFFFGAGKALLELGYRNESADLLRRCLDLNADHVAAVATLGVIAMQQDDDAQALTCFARALALHPGFDLAELNLGLLHGRRGRREESAAHLRRAAELNPQRWQTAVALGDWHFQIGELEEAARWYDAAGAMPGHGADVYVKRCSTALARGDVEGARRLAWEAGRRDARFADLEAMLPPKIA